MSPTRPSWAPTMVRLVASLDLLALGLALGAVVFFALGTAPAAFEVLPERRLAGDLVRAAMLRLQAWEALLLGWLFLSHALGAWGWGLRRSGWWLLVLLGLAATWVASAWVIDPAIHALRVAHPLWEAVPAGHPDRVAFGAWHGASTLALGVRMLGWAALLLAASGRPQAMEAPPPQ